MSKLVAALACRAGGSRLYGKPLQYLDIEKNLTVIEYMIRCLTGPPIDEIVLGVSEGPENEPFHDIARRCGLKSIRGDQIDVLMRLIQCGEAADGTDVFRVTTESPFTYFEPIGEAWKIHCAKDNDVTNVAGLPDGSGFEILKLDALRRCHERGDHRHRSELATLYVKEHRDEFQLEVIDAPPEVNRLDLRLTIDYPEDLVLCRRIYHEFRDLAPRIPLARIVAFIDKHPELNALVQPYVVGERWYA